MPHLKSLTLELEATQDEVDTARTVVEWIGRVWRLPLNPKHPGHLGCDHLSAEGNAVRRESCRAWRSLWDKDCHSCYENMAKDVPSCARHADVRRKWELGLGPRVFTWEIKLTPRRCEGPGTSSELYYLEPSQLDLSEGYASDDSGLGSDGDEDVMAEDGHVKWSQPKTLKMREKRSEIRSMEELR
ncbi:hypothetical protein DHEL01_v211970 [Diaporthe helianthi]|uniref:Uncharacterized protein n=1 Tax=Diaporthe helianthi TaxID=158607 RepID=A0A2P5HHB5_DIAHE|nr:hypothetical protein DHEL01_v211970 [Diaporthe helianthi]